MGMSSHSTAEGVLRTGQSPYSASSHLGGTAFPIQAMPEGLLLGISNWKRFQGSTSAVAATLNSIWNPILSTGHADSAIGVSGHGLLSAETGPRRLSDMSRKSVVQRTPGAG